MKYSKTSPCCGGSLTEMTERRYQSMSEEITTTVQCYVCKKQFLAKVGQFEIWQTGRIDNFFMIIKEAVHGS